ncbi:MAG: fatty-acid synthase [bacterium]|nr:fatty-acid synthase [bacterium]
MPAKDLYHEVVRAALVKDGWTITHDPLTLRWGKKDLFVDLGAEKLLAAEKGDRRIAVEIKSFLGKSEVADLQRALGQYIMYRDIMKAKESDRDLYLAVRELVYSEVFEEPIGQLLLKEEQVRLMIFDEGKEEVLRWIP